MSFKAELLMEEYRGQVVENVHYGHICCIDSKKEIIKSKGDPHHYTYMRSTAKPIQLLPFLDMGLDKKYALTDQEITIMAGSQFAAEYHIEVLESIASKIGISESDLICLPSLPFDDENRLRVIKNNLPARRFYSVCAGKHLALIALAKELGNPVNTYYDPESQAQKLVKSYIAQVSEYDEEKIKIGIDGCGVPVFAMPIVNMAKAFFNMVYPDDISGAQTRESAKKIVSLYKNNSDYITNRGFFCTEFNKDPNVFAKGGADGVYCFVLKKEKIAVSFKIADGSEVEWNLIIARILELLGYENKNTIEKIISVRPKEILSASGAVCGEYNPVFTFEGSDN